MEQRSRGEQRWVDGDSPLIGSRRPGREQSDMRSAGTSARTHRRRSLPIEALGDGFRIDGIDVVASRDVLARVGAEGSAGLDRMSSQETIELLTRLRDLSAAIAAVQARALVHLEDAVKEDCRAREETPEQAVRIARAEASMVLKQSSSCAGQSMSSSRRLVRSMPGILAALAHGRIAPVSAHRVGRTMGPASPDQRARVDEILTAHLPYLEDCGPEEWSGEAEKVLHALDPHGAADRHRTAAKDRSVTVRRGEHGMCTLSARLPGIDGARIRKGLSIAAEKARAQGDRRGHQQIMADLLADALIGRGEGIDPTTLEIGVIITDRSLLAPDHADAATIEGYGPVPFEHVRAEMLEAVESAQDDPELAMTLRRLYIEEGDGQLVAADSVARSFPPALSRFLRIAHQTCRAPHCDASIRQNDHIDPWSHGGATSLDNGNGLCAACNQKEAAGQTARVIHDSRGRRRSVEWTSRYGQRARRRGINFDPLGTGARRLDRLAAEAQPLRGADPMPSDVEPLSTLRRALELVGHGTAMTESDPVLQGAEAAQEVDIAQGADREEWRRRKDRLALRARRRDHIFFPHLTLIVDTPWRGPEANAA